ncbi:MAG: type II toxin-antitoxin system VapC family toxin [Candidatus Hodarchaeales archaeon]
MTPSSEKPANSDVPSSYGTFLIDTSVLIDCYKEHDLHSITGQFLSVITVLEFIRGMSKNKDEEVLQKLKQMFQIVPFDADIILQYSSLYRTLKSSGQLIGDADLIIAATAITKDLVLWTGTGEETSTWC